MLQLISFYFERGYSMENFAAFIFASAMLAVIPGPDILFVITQGITFGKKQALLTATGLVTGCIFHTTLAAFGVSVIFQRSKTAFFSLKIAGACYLLYLAYCALKSNGNLSCNINSSQSGFKKGILMNILNPKVALFFIAFLPQFVSSETKHFALDMIILGTVFAFVSWCIFAVCALLASKFNQFIKNNENFGIYVNKFAALAYIVIAMWLFFA